MTGIKNARLLVSVAVFCAWAGPCLAGAYDTVVINEIMTANASAVLDTYWNEFSDWVEIYNGRATPVDLTGCYLSDNPGNPLKWRISQTTVIPAGGRKIFWCDGTDVYNHTSFELGQDDGAIALSAPDGTLIDSVAYETMLTDASYGRQPDGSVTWRYFGRPTPETANSTTGVAIADRAKAPVFSRAGGIYQAGQSVALQGGSVTAVIRYTLDGSIPGETSLLYSGSIPVGATGVIRARAYDTGKLPSKVVTNTYFISEDLSLPVMSIATDPANLWDNEIGILAWGDVDPETAPKPYYDANFWQDWERPINIEFYEVDGTAGFNLAAGVQTYGGATVACPQKSLFLLARDKYGPKEIEYQVFPDKDIDRFKRLVLRNSGNDWAKTLYRDAMIQSLLEDRMDLDVQAYRPVVVFINGEYWGIYALREKMDEYYPESNYGVDHDDVDLLNHKGEDLAGSSAHYDSLLDFLDENVLTETNYAYVKTRMNVNEYLNYMIAQIYIVNTDWPGGNLRLWRPDTASGIWRWMVFDTDFGFGLYNTYAMDMMAFATDDDYPNSWPNPPYSTFLFRKLLGSTEFRSEFIQRFAAHVNTTFEPSRVIGVIDAMKAELAGSMPRHIALWGGQDDGWMGYDSFTSLEEWETNIAVMRTFAGRRPGYARQHIVDYFPEVSGTANLTVNVLSSGQGRVFTHDVSVTDSSFTGVYFRDVPVRLLAVPVRGYRFVRWQGAVSGTANPAAVTLSGDATVTAVFETAPSNVMINEIHYNPAPEQGADEDYEFLELYNAGEGAADLSFWTFDAGIGYTFPSGAAIAPGEYVVVANNAVTYTGCGSRVYEWTSGKLANEGELIRLLDADGQVVDSVTYGTVSPWPASPDSDGPSLSLRLPSLDNSLAASWAASGAKGGTPGRYNFEGDLNEDGAVNVSDVMLAQKMSLGFIAENLLPADLNQDGFVDTRDVVLLLRRALGYFEY